MRRAKENESKDRNGFILQITPQELQARLRDNSLHHVQAVDVHNGYINFDCTGGDDLALLQLDSVKQKP